MQIIPERAQYPYDYVGIVENIDDPEKYMRVQVRVYELFSDSVPTADLPWAVYRLPVGARVNDGYFTPCDVGDIVWVDFPHGGDTRRPRITGSVHHIPDGIPNLPHESFVGSDLVEHKTVGREPIAAAPVYHYDCVYTQHGFTVKINEDKSMSIIQRATGTEIYIAPDGVLKIHAEEKYLRSSRAQSDRYSADKDYLKVEGGGRQIDITGNEDRTVSGNVTRSAGGSRTDDIGGSETRSVGGAKSDQIGGAWTAQAPTIELTAGAITLNGNVCIKANLTVNGRIFGPMPVPGGC